MNNPQQSNLLDKGNSLQSIIKSLHLITKTNNKTPHARHLHNHSQHRLLRQNYLPKPIRTHQSLNDKSIQSKVYLKQVDFELKKINFKKNKTRQRPQQTFRYISIIPPLQTTTMNSIKQTKDPFEPYCQLDSIQEEEDAFSHRLKTIVDLSKKQMKTLYVTHQKQIKSVSLKKKHMKTQSRKPKNEDFISNKKIISTFGRESHSFPNCLPINSIILRKTIKKGIEQSFVRDKDDSFQKIRLKEQKEEFNKSARILLKMRQDIDQMNKKKQSIVFAGLKKLFYGDRKGRHIKDNTLRTILKGECKEGYMKIAREQEILLENFHGSSLNRRNLVQKFSNILGSLRKNEKHLSPHSVRL